MENTPSPLAQQTLPVVAFRLDHRAFALPLNVVMQILPMMAITPIPHTNKSIKGTINVRGEDVLVINLRGHFGMEEEALQLYTPILLLKLHQRSLAFIVDSVMDVLNLPLQKVTNLPDILPEGIESVPVLRGVAHQNDETVLVLDPDHLFDNHLHFETSEHAPATKAAPVVNIAEEVAPAIENALAEETE